MLFASEDYVPRSMIVEDFGMIFKICDVIH